MLNEQGEKIVIINTATEVTERCKALKELTDTNQEYRNTQTNLQDANQRLKVALDAGNFGTTEVDQAETISDFGIKLYLSSEIIARHQRRIGVESEPGKGYLLLYLPQT